MTSGGLCTKYITKSSTLENHAFDLYIIKIKKYPALSIPFPEFIQIIVKIVKMKIL